MLPRLGARARLLWDRAIREHSSPRKIGCSVGLGAFAAFIPCVPFLHAGVAFALATLFRVNRLWAMLGSRLSTTPVQLTTAFIEIEWAHRLRTGAWAPIALHEVMAHGRELLLDWALGSLLFAPPAAVCVGMASYAVARRYAALTARMPAGDRSPSSECPPSAPPAPSP
jgi:uncharacterized protein (DUF2062 family)